MGFSFKQFCRKNHQLIAGRLGFKNVEYRHGVFNLETYEQVKNRQLPKSMQDLAKSMTQTTLKNAWPNVFVLHVKFSFDELWVEFVKVLEKLDVILNHPKSQDY